LLNLKQPGAVKFIRVLIRGAVKAGGADPGIDRPSKFTVFDYSHWLAGKVEKSPSLACGLNPAVVHSEDKTSLFLLDYLLLVQSQ